MLVSIEGKGPLFQRVYDALRGAILRGDLAQGARLPSSRGLASDLGLSRTTVLLAYEQLHAEGYVTGRVGSGTYVATELPDMALRSAEVESGRPRDVADIRVSTYAQRLASMAVVPEDPAPRVRYDFRYGTPALDGQLIEIWRRMLTRTMRKASLRSLLYGPPEGAESLRQAVAAYLIRSRAVRCRPEQVVIVNGSQQALDLTARVLIDPGDHVLIEDPCYLGTRKVFAAAGANLVAAAVDDEGLDAARLPAAADDARLACVAPSHQFPSGATMALGRRLSLLGWAERRGAFIFEDDYDSEYRYEGRPIESMQGLDQTGRVIYAGTFSKVVFPALRVGYVVLPESLIEPFVAAKWLSDRHTPTLEQDTLAAFIREGHFERHLRRARTRNAARRATLLESLDRFFGDRIEIQGANAGMHMVVWLHDMTAVELERLITRARTAGVGISSVAPYYQQQPPGAGLLLGYANLAESEIEAGIACLAAIPTGPEATRRARGRRS